MYVGWGTVGDFVSLTRQAFPCGVVAGEGVVDRSIVDGAGSRVAAVPHAAAPGVQSPRISIPLYPLGSEILSPPLPSTRIHSWSCSRCFMLVLWFCKLLFHVSCGFGGGFLLLVVYVVNMVV